MLKLLRLSIQRLDIWMTCKILIKTYFDGMVKQIYSSELQLNKANSSDTAAFQSWFAIEYLSCFISVMGLDLYVHCFNSLKCRGSSITWTEQLLCVHEPCAAEPRVRLLQSKTGLSPTGNYF